MPKKVMYASVYLNANKLFKLRIKGGHDIKRKACHSNFNDGVIVFLNTF